MNKEVCWWCLKPMGNSLHKVNGKSLHQKCEKEMDRVVVARRAVKERMVAVVATEEEGHWYYTMMAVVAVIGFLFGAFFGLSIVVADKILHLQEAELGDNCLVLGGYEDGRIFWEDCRCAIMVEGQVEWRDCTHEERKLSWDASEKISTLPIFDFIGLSWD